jgi:hypothetical protein
LRMIEQIGTAAPMEVALLGAFTLILGAFTLILWDLLGGRRRGWLRVMAVLVGAPACALAATVISAGIGWTVAVTLEPDEQLPPARTEQRKPQNQQRTSSAEGRGPETTTERSASPTATPSASPTPSASATATASPSP